MYVHKRSAIAAGKALRAEAFLGFLEIAYAAAPAAQAPTRAPHAKATAGDFSAIAGLLRAS
jgi:hypothetical protein